MQFSIAASFSSGGRKVNYFRSCRPNRSRTNCCFLCYLSKCWAQHYAHR